MGTSPEENKPNVKGTPSLGHTTFRGLMDLFKSNVTDTIAYIFLAIGLLYCFFEPFVGEIPVGFILGLYFSSYAFRLMALFKEFLITEGIFRGFIVIAGMAALLIAAPGLFIGLAVGIFSRPYLGKLGL